MSKYTVYFDQTNRTNFQVKAETLQEAKEKAKHLYRKHLDIPAMSVELGWISESDGEDD